MERHERQGLHRLIVSRKRWDVIFALVGILALMLTLMTFVALFAHMASQGWARLGVDFLMAFPSRDPEQAGILSAWVGSLLVMLVTAGAAIPLGVATGVYLEEYAAKNWLTDLIEINVTNLAGVPSIIYGLLALGLFVHTFGFGQSILTAGLTLALLTLPIVIVTTREALRAIPRTIREGAYACGATNWQVVSGHLLPYSGAGILTGVIIGMARAIGETAPIITIGALTFVAFLPPAPFRGEPPAGVFDWLFSPFTTMPIQMFNWTSRPQAAFLDNAAAAGFVLVLMTVLMNALAIWLRHRLRRGGNR